MILELFKKASLVSVLGFALTSCGGSGSGGNSVPGDKGVSTLSAAEIKAQSQLLGNQYTDLYYYAQVGGNGSGSGSGTDQEVQIEPYIYHFTGVKRNLTVDGTMHNTYVISVCSYSPIKPARKTIPLSQVSGNDFNFATDSSFSYQMDGEGINIYLLDETKPDGKPVYSSLPSIYNYDAANKVFPTPADDFYHVYYLDLPTSDKLVAFTPDQVTKMGLKCAVNSSQAAQ